VKTTTFVVHVTDTLKIYTLPHGNKPDSLVINVGREDWVLKKGKTLSEQGIQHETEISFYRADDFIAWEANPEIKW
jgi:hypothetical protein